MSVFSDWIEIRDDKSPWRISDFPYDKGVDSQKTKPHCIKCVAVNNCWFKNEKIKKPLEYAEVPPLPYKPALLELKYYHPNCHCWPKAIASPKTKDIKIIALDEKMKYLMKAKFAWIQAMGYDTDDENEIYEKLLSLAKQAYCEGRYSKADPNEDMIRYGFKVNIDIKFPGKGEKEGHTYNLKTCYMIFPNGTLKNNTPIGGWSK